MIYRGPSSLAVVRRIWGFGSSPTSSLVSLSNLPVCRRVDLPIGKGGRERARSLAVYKINRITAAIGVILAFTGKKMFYFNQKSEVPPKN
jgi:hypothetical protein